MPAPTSTYYPAHYDNRYGYLDDHRLNRFKLNGFFNIKGDWTIGFDAFYSSAFVWEPRPTAATAVEDLTTDRSSHDIPYGVCFVEPRGSHEANSNYQLDLQLSKGFTIGSAVRMVLIGSVFNVFSNEEVTGVCISINGCGTNDGDIPSDR